MIDDMVIGFILSLLVVGFVLINIAGFLRGKEWSDYLFEMSKAHYFGTARPKRPDHLFSKTLEGVAVALVVIGLLVALFLAIFWMLGWKGG